MTILGIETSCDETAASVVKDGREILSHVLATSADMHAKTGGVIPEQAAREQVKSIIPVIETAIENCKLKIENLDAIAVTYGPGLIGSLLVGVETAKTLACVWNKPIVPVNHLVAHIYANFIREMTNDKFQMTNWKEPELPAVALVVSGGHTDLVYLKSHGEMEYIGGTRDDAAGEAFDKTARLLGLKGFMGGPAIAAAAAKFEIRNSKYEIKLPRPMIDSNDYDFSFSGLKTAVANFYKVNPKVPIEEFAYEIQEAITDVLVEKSLKAVKKYNTSTLLLAGGVAANYRLTEKFKLEIGKRKLEIDFRVPEPKLCTDSASYIAACANYNYHPIPWQGVSANPSLTITGSPV